MKKLVYLIIILILVLLSAYIAISYIPNYTETPTIKNNDHKIQTYTVGQEPSGRDLLIQMYKDTKAARKRNQEYELRDEEIEKCIRQKTKNWKRVYYKRSYEKVFDDDEKEWITTNEFYEKKREFHGYDEDEDWKLRFKLRNRALEGEEIC